ncbi:MAG: alpha/beta fold hydrolase, partial [Gammaproteobacteria bacterium]
MKNEPDLERSICGLLREPLAFWSFRLAAGAPDAKRLRSIRDSEHLSFRTRDGRSLGGYKLRAVKPWGYLLVAQGNAMLADHIIGEFQFFRDLGLDVYLYDYRGYGLSDGKSRLKALVSDYHEIVRALNAQEYRRRFLYGISMGGIVLLDAVGKTREYDAAVID